MLLSIHGNVMFPHLSEGFIYRAIRVLPQVYHDGGCSTMKRPTGKGITKKTKIKSLESSFPLVDRFFKSVGNLICTDESVS